MSGLVPDGSRPRVTIGHLSSGAGRGRALDFFFFGRPAEQDRTGRAGQRKMAAATTAEPEESRVMFSRWFTSCFQSRQERSALSSQKDSLHPAEGFSETESGASTFHVQHSPPRHQQQAPPSQSQPHLRTAPGPSIPLPVLRTKDPDPNMPKAPRKTKTPAARLGLTVRPKKKSVLDPK